MGGYHTLNPLFIKYQALGPTEAVAVAACVCVCVCVCVTGRALTLIVMPVLSFTRVWLLTTTIPEDDTFSSGGSGVVISFQAMTMSFEQSSAGVGIMLKIEAVVFPETCRSDTHAIGVQVTQGAKASNSNGSRHRVRWGQRGVRRRCLNYRL